MRRIFVLSLAILLLIGLLPLGAQSARQTAVVVAVIDGDTVDVQFPGSGEIRRVRYIGIDTPERGDTCYRAASVQNEVLVLNETVTLVRDVSETDRYGRLLRYVYVGDLFVNAEMVRLGVAEAKDYPPDTANSSLLYELEGEAIAAEVGCLHGGQPAPEAGGSTYYVTGSIINVRSCERSTCDRVTTLSYGAAVTVLGQVSGELVSGTTTWYRVRLASGEAYIHSSLLNNVAPATPRPAPVNPAGSGQGSGNAVSTPVPAAPASTAVPQPAAPAFACNCSKTCTQMTCTEAYFQLQQCGCSQRDGDGDGRPCESQCGG